MITSCCFNELFIGLKKRYSMPRDLASLTRRLLEVSREIERLESENGGANAPTATEVEDGPFDPSEI